MTQTSGDLWARLQRPLLDATTRFAWAAPVFGGLRLVVDGRERPLDRLFARIVFNDAESESLCVGFGESDEDRSASRILIGLERRDGNVRLEASLGGRLPKELFFGERQLAGHPGAGDASAGTLQGPFPAVAVLYL